ncbi:MAG: hypothetical protein AAB971_00580 [Patescibacteria group bacterium]
MKKNQQGFGSVQILLILVIVGIIGFVGWYVYNANQGASNNYKTASSEAAKSPSKKATPKSAATDKVTISAALKENTAAAIESGNTAALEGYMADSVTVVIAASEKGGAESAAEAVQDLAYLSSGTSPWDFNLAATTLTSYKNGFYGKYFGDSTIVGQSANKYVVSFGVNSSGKIDTVFMAASSDLLL